MQCVVPGEVLGAVGECNAGEGTYVREGKIHASVVGKKRQRNDHDSIIIEVVRPDAKPTVVPKLHDVVIGKVTKVTPRSTNIQIMCVALSGSTEDLVPLSHEFPAVLRQHDVRQTQVDQVEMYKCFRPGDIVRAEVISFGDKKSYYVSTAQNQYGVLFAKSVAGATMVPLSWDLMQCPKTKMTEHRKVAKIS